MSQNKRIFWVSSLILDVHLHKIATTEPLRELSKRGYKIFFFTSYSSIKDFQGLTDLHVICFPLRYVPFISMASYTLILFLLMPLLVLYYKPKYLIISPPNVIALMSILLFPRCKRPKIVLDVRSTPVRIHGIMGFINNQTFGISLKIAKRYFEGITTLTELMKKEICLKYKISLDRIGVWTTGVSTEVFRSDIHVETKMKKKYRLEDSFVVLYHGIMGRNRGIIESIKAMELLRDEYPNIILFLLGRAIFSLNNFVQKRNLQNTVLVHDAVSYSEVPKYIDMCNVGIVPLPNLSIWRNQLPLKLLEYLAMKKVVLATDIPANRGILGKSKCGIYISSTEPKEIAKAIVYAYTNRRMLKKWGSYGRKIVERRYSWKKVAENLEAYISGL